MVKKLQENWRSGVIIAVVSGAIAGVIDMFAAEIQPALFLILVATCLLGFLQPQRAWLWALIIGGSILVVHLLGMLVGFQPSYPVEPNVWVTSIALLPALIGAYLGAITRRLLKR